VTIGDGEVEKCSSGTVDARQDGVGLDEPWTKSCRSNDEIVVVEDGSKRNGSAGDEHRQVRWGPI